MKDERAGNVGLPHTATIEDNAYFVQQRIQLQLPWISIRRVAAAVQINQCRRIVSCV